MNTGAEAESIYPRSFANSGLSPSCMLCKAILLYALRAGSRLVGISLRLGEKWFQPNGRLKDMACRELLLTLSRMGLITLPPRLNSANNEKRNRSISVVNIDQIPLQDKLGKLAPVELKPVRNTKLEPLYNSLIHQHRYLGYRQIVGLRLVE